MDYFGSFGSADPFGFSYVPVNNGFISGASDFGVKYGTNLANDPNYNLGPSAITPLPTWNPAPSIFAPPIYDTPQMPFTHTPSPWINSAPPGRAPDASPYDGHSSLGGIDYSRPTPPGAPAPLADLDYGYQPATNPFAMYDMMGMG